MSLRLCFYILIAVFLSSCSARYYMKRGNQIYATGRYYKASSKYEKSYNKAKPKEYQANAAMHAGLCHENTGKPKEAYSWYNKARRANEELPEAYLKMAEVSVRQGEFETAREQYGRYEELFQDGKGKDGIYHLDLLQKDLVTPGRYMVELKKEFNSRYNDFSPVYYPGDTCIVYFTSTRNGDTKKKKRRIDPVTGDEYSHIFITDFTQEIRSVDKNGNVSVKKFKEPRWLKPELVKDSLYSSRNEGALCFSADGNTLYFTSSRIVDGYNRGTRIYKAARGNAQDDSGNRKAGWINLSKSGICGDTVSVGHPALTPDGKRLYFVTDQLPGGFGGKDIWYVENREGKWSEPVNAGEVINTSGDEMYPYVRDNGDLYFASDGHYGMGGLDLYRVETADGKEQLRHLPAPINSFADDFGIIFKPGTDEGLLSSARSGRTDKIYSFCFIPQQLQVRMLARNAITELPITKVQVTVTSDNGEIVYLETDSVGIVSMPVVSDREYVFVTENPAFLKGKGILSTYREKSDRLYELTVDMQPIERPIVIPDIYFDVAKWDLRPEAKENLNELLVILKDNPNIAIELSAHTDMVGNDKANMILSENRAQSVVDYLIEKGVYWDRLEAKGYGKTQPRQINEKDAKAYPFLKAGDILNERFVGRLRGTQREDALQLNRRIEFKVLRTNYKPGPNSLHNPNRKAIAVEEKQTVHIGTTQLRDLKSVQGKFFTLQLGVFRNVPVLINQFKVVFTEQVKDGIVRYCTGIYDTREEAVAAAAQLKAKGIETMIREY